MKRKLMVIERIIGRLVILAILTYLMYIIGSIIIRELMELIIIDTKFQFRWYYFPQYFN